MKKIINYIAISITIITTCIIFISDLLKFINPTYNDMYYKFIDTYGGLKLHNIILVIFILACDIQTFRLYLKYKKMHK